MGLDRLYTSPHTCLYHFWRIYRHNGGFDSTTCNPRYRYLNNYCSLPTCTRNKTPRHPPLIEPRQSPPQDLPPTTVTEQTTLPSVTMAQLVTATPSGFYYTPKPTVTTMKVFTSIPTSTPTQKSPFGIEFSILAISAAILIVRSRYRKP